MSEPSLIERARDPRNQFLFNPEVSDVAWKLVYDLTNALEAAEAKIVKLVDLYDKTYADKQVFERRLAETQECVKELADEPCEYGDNCTNEAMHQRRHGQCLHCKARTALAGASDHDYASDPCDAADDELSHWTDDGDLA